MITCECPQLKGIRDKESELDKIGRECRKYANLIDGKKADYAVKEDFEESFVRFIDSMNSYSSTVLRAILEDESIKLKDIKGRDINLKYVNLEDIKEAVNKYCIKCESKIEPIRFEDYGFSLKD